MGKIRRLSEVDIYHIYLRGNSKNIIFYDDDDRRLFCRCLEKAREKCTAKIYAYALMDNHMHLLVKCKTINKLVSSLMVSFVMQYNFKYKISGKLCQTYGSSAKDSYSKIRESIVYILQNPVKAYMCNNPGEYKWSSYHSYFFDFTHSSCSSSYPNPSGTGSNPKFLRWQKNEKRMKGGEASSIVKVDTSFVEEMFESKSNFDLLLNNISVNEKDVKEKEDNWKRISHEELCRELRRILDGKELFSLSKNELRKVACELISSTSASFTQISSLLHVSYEFVRRCKPSAFLANCR